ncbi:calcium-binding protein [Nocardioides humilatus]|nr:calcium-binding protein [Nocardioides humilatus]
MNLRRTPLRLLMVAAVTLASFVGVVTGAPTASAVGATIVAIEGDTLTVTSPPGLINTISVGRDGTTFKVKDLSSPYLAGGGCTPGAGGWIDCPGSGVQAVEVDLGDQNDYLYFSSLEGLSTWVDLGPGDDFVQDDKSDDIINGGAGNDLVSLQAGGADWVFGEDGADVVSYYCTTAPSFCTGTGGVSVTLDGRPNDGPAGEHDFIDPRTEQVIGTGDDDVLIGNGRPNDLLAREGNDVVDGRGGDDHLDGGHGDDTIRSSTKDGADVIVAGAGTDTVDYSARSAAVKVRLTGAVSGEVGEGDTLDPDLERVLTGSGADDISFEAAAARGPSDPPVQVSAGAGNDKVTGSPYADILRGEAGSDTVSGLAGNDTLDGGTANDVFNGGSGTDTADYTSRIGGISIDLDGVADDGNVAVNEGDNVKADVENLLGGAGPDTLTGSNYANVLDGGAGADTLNGLGSNDTLRDGGGNADVLVGGAGIDVADYGTRTTGLTIDLDGIADDGTTGGSENDNVQADIEILRLGSGADVVTGSASANVIYGHHGNDSIDGGAGSDTLYGEEGNDTLTGGTGTDTVNGGNGTDSCFGETQVGCP